MPSPLRSSRARPLTAAVVAGLVVLALLPTPRGRVVTVPSRSSTPAVSAGAAAAGARVMLDDQAAAWYAEASRQEAARAWYTAAALDASARARAYTSRPPAPATGDGGATVSSTAYCLTGGMADGHPTRYGAVAANRWPLGTRLRVSPSPVGEIVTVEDRIGSGSELDFALPGDCGAARSWGRRTVTVEVLDA